MSNLEKETFANRFIMLNQNSVPFTGSPTKHTLFLECNNCESLLDENYNQECPSCGYELKGYVEIDLTQDPSFSQIMKLSYNDLEKLSKK